MNIAERNQQKKQRTHQSSLVGVGLVYHLSLARLPAIAAAFAVACLPIVCRFLFPHPIVAGDARFAPSLLFPMTPMAG